MSNNKTEQNTPETLAEAELTQVCAGQSKVWGDPHVDEIVRPRVSGDLELRATSGVRATGIRMSGIRAKGIRKP